MGYRGPNTITNDMLAGGITEDKHAAAAAQTVNSSDFTLQHNNKSVLIVTVDADWMELVSDSTTAIADGAIEGQLLLVKFASSSEYTSITIKDSANTDLGGDWKRSQNDPVSAELADCQLLLIWTDGKWRKVLENYGANNTVTGMYSVAHGTGNIITEGQRSFAQGQNNSMDLVSHNSYVGGQDNIVSGGNCLVMGYGNQALHNNCLVVGRYAIARKEAFLAQSSGKLDAAGDSQFVRAVLGRETYQATPTRLKTMYCNYEYPLQDETLFYFTIKLAARRNTGSQHARYERRALIHRTGGVCSLLQLETIGTDYEDNTAWGVSITADDTNKVLGIEVTGAASTHIHWVAVVEAVEVACHD